MIICTTLSTSNYASLNICCCFSSDSTSVTSVNAVRCHCIVEFLSCSAAMKGDHNVAYFYCAFLSLINKSTLSNLAELETVYKNRLLLCKKNLFFVHAYKLFFSFFQTGAVF